MTLPEANRASLRPFFFSDKMRSSKKRKTMEIGRMSELLPKRRRLDDVQKKSIFSASRLEVSSTPPRRASPEPLSAQLLTAPASLSPSNQMKNPKKRKMANRHDDVQQQPKKVRSPAVPEDLNFEIMERLPARSVGRFRCVSKTWLSIATSRSFIKAHVARSRITRQMLVITDPGISPESHSMIKFYEANLHAGICFRELLQLKMMDEANPLASCDGLILLRCIPTSLCCIPLSQFCIINPLTGSSGFLPQNTLCFSNFLGFYFHRPASEYRILGSLDSGISYVNAVGEGNWRRIQDRRPASYQIFKSVDVGRSLYWLAWKKSPDDDNVFPGTTPPTNVMAFDKEAE